MKGLVSLPSQNCRKHVVSFEHGMQANTRELIHVLLYDNKASHFDLAKRENE